MNCIETKNLIYRFPNGEMALKGINLRIPQGSIYGFLGPNGAGKTTTLKLLLGLLKNQEGEISLFGKELQQERIGILNRIGSLIENPSLYGHLGAKDNLRILQKTYRCPTQRIDEVLHLVGLSGVGNKKTAHFSLGMKQRLGIACALLNNPSLLILDEPTNGLDPHGIIEVRELLKKLNTEHNITIVISSHMLAEVEKLVNHVGIIHQGKLLFQGPKNELMGKRNAYTTLVIDTSDNKKAMNLLNDEIIDCEIEEDRIITDPVSREMIATVNKALMQNGIDVYELHRVEKDLETIFMHLLTQTH